VACMRDRRGIYRVWVGRPEVRRPLRRSGGGLKYNTKMGLQDVGWERHGLDCSGSG
jgi:hypothetical protein